jgi:hypothetical protein
MSDLVLLLLVVCTLVLLDILAQDFGADSRPWRDPSRSPWPGF